MTTLNDLVIRTRRRALSDIREETDTLGNDIPKNASTLSLGQGQSLGSIRAGAILEIDYELFFVLSTPSSASAIPVLPGYLDTTSTSHDKGSLITVNPRFPNADIATAMNEIIDELSSPTHGLFKMNVTSVNFNPVLVGYDIPGIDTSTYLSIYEIRVHDYGPAERWPLIPPSQYKVQHLSDPAVSPSSTSLKFYGPGYPGRPIRIMWKGAYSTPLLNPSDDVEVVTGLHFQAHDLPTLGSMERLVNFREIKRSFSETQSEARRATEVPVGSSLTAIKGITAIYQARIADERNRLNKIYPPVRR